MMQIIHQQVFYRQTIIINHPSADVFTCKSPISVFHRQTIIIQITRRYTSSAVARPLAARLRHKVDRQLAPRHVVARLRRDAPAHPAAVVEEALQLRVGVARRARRAALVKGADAALRAARARQLLCVPPVSPRARAPGAPLHSPPGLKRRSPWPLAMSTPTWSLTCGREAPPLRAHMPLPRQLMPCAAAPETRTRTDARSIACRVETKALDEARHGPDGPALLSAAGALCDAASGTCTSFHQSPAPSHR